LQVQRAALDSAVADDRAGLDLRLDLHVGLQWFEVWIPDWSPADGGPALILDLIFIGSGAVAGRAGFDLRLDLHLELRCEVWVAD
jgi:hypothetical protein